MSGFGFTRMFLEKWRKVPWHGYGSEYLQGTADGMEMVICD
jgi:hypothetical protein